MYTEFVFVSQKLKTKFLKKKMFVSNFEVEGDGPTRASQ